MRCRFRIAGIDCPLCSLALARSLSGIKELTTVKMPFLGTTVDIETWLSPEELRELLSGVSEKLHGKVEFIPLESGEEFPVGQESVPESPGYRDR